MSVALRLDAADPTPPYEQLRRQLAAAIETRQLAPGSRLPAVRQLAGDLGVAPGTVMRSYAELESAGLIETRRGAGTVVAAVPPSMPEAARQARLSEGAAGFVAQMRLLGFTGPQIAEAVARECVD